MITIKILKKTLDALQEIVNTFKGILISLRQIYALVKNNPILSIIIIFISGYFLIGFLIINFAFNQPVSVINNWTKWMPDETQRRKVWDMFTEKRKSLKRNNPEEWLLDHSKWISFKVKSIEPINNDDCASNPWSLASYYPWMFFKCINYSTQEIQVVYEVTEMFGAGLKTENNYWLQIYKILRNNNSSTKDQKITRRFKEIFEIQKINEKWLINLIKRQEVTLLVQ